MKKAIFILLTFTLVFSAFVANASVSKTMINGKQDFLVMGSVKDIKEEDIIITVDHVLGMDTSSMIGKDITVSKFVYSYCTGHSPSDFSNPIVSDNVVISIDFLDNKYVIKNGAFKVDSNEYSTCKIVNHIDEDDEDCLKTLAEITCFIRSNAKVKKFTYDENGTIYAVYPQTKEQCIKFIDDDGKAITTDNHVEDTLPEEVTQNTSKSNDDAYKNKKWIYIALIFVVGAFAGLVVSYLYSKKKVPKN